MLCTKVKQIPLRGITERKARATAKARARTKANANAGPSTTFLSGTPLRMTALVVREYVVSHTAWVKTLAYLWFVLRTKVKRIPFGNERKKNEGKDKSRPFALLRMTMWWCGDLLYPPFPPGRRKGGGTRILLFG